MHERTSVELETTVSTAEAGQRLDSFLAGSLGSRSRAARLIESGRVTVNGSPAQKRRTVARGDRVVVAAATSRGTRPTRPEGPPARYAVAYEDRHLIVVDKPAGMVVHPARGHRQGTLAQELADRAAGGEDPARAGIVHRLDKDTSGLLVVAKGEDVHRALREMLSARAIHREYVAMVDGTPQALSGTIEASIGRDRRDRVLVSLDTDTPRAARTHFTLLERLGPVTLIRVELETGRTHQIRVHMQAIGNPVTGDAAYGGSSRFGLTRQFLHSERLSFTHPVTGDSVDVTAPLPDDLRRALRLARDRG